MGAGAAVTTATTDTRNYAAPSLPAGVYDNAVTSAGFKRPTAATVEVHSTQTATENLVLEAGGVNESVTVTSEVALINPNSAAVTTTVGRVDQIGGLIIGQLNSFGFRTVPTTAYVVF